MNLKPSQFNFAYKRNDDNIVFNTFTKACVALDNETFSLLQGSDIPYTEHENNTLDYLKENGFLVSADFDEVGFLRYYNYKVRFAEDYLSLTIAPTLSCNFDCPYCFENKRGGTIDKETQTLIMEFLKEKLSHGVKKMDLTWYGGEPLLCFDIIKEMCHEIAVMTSEFDVQCKMGMITNGYLINNDVADLLEKYNISAQITLDGLAENHDNRRYLRNGGATFDRIVENLHCFDNRNIDVYIRMNVDKFNASDYPALTQLIHSFHNPRMILYPAVTENVNERKESRKDYYMPDRIYDTFISDTRKQGLFHKDVDTVPISNDISKLPDNRSYFCAAELENSFVIDEKGHVYKCWNEVGKDNYCFSLKEPDKINYNSLLNYMGDITFSDTKCTKCPFLPICFGGCKFHRANFNRYSCAFSETSVKAYIEDTFFQE